MSGFDKDVQKILAHIRFLSESIGGRGSCTEQEFQAGEYVVRQMRALSVKDIFSDTFEAVPATYWGFGLAFGAALTGSLLVLLFDGIGVLILAALLNIAGTWGMLAETDFGQSWVRWFLPRKPSRNVGGMIHPKFETRRRVVLCAHVDTHRTPIFYSSMRWYALFNVLVGTAFLSMVAGSLIFSLGAAFNWEWARWVSPLTAAIQLAAIFLCLHADFTPYSPGANDNASGVAVALTIAERLRREPPANTEIHLAFTGCEEVGNYGMIAYLDRYAARLGPDAVYVVLDEVGLGRLKYLLTDGLLVHRSTHPEAVRLAREAKKRLPDLEVTEGNGTAYTDALAATKRGLIALTLCTIPREGGESHWHRPSDRVETLAPGDLAAAQHFTWTLLQVIDEEARRSVTGGN